MADLAAAPVSFDSLLIHTVTIERTSYGTTLDDYGQPTATVTSTDVPAMVQPRQFRQTEVLDTRSAGVATGDYRVFLREVSITPKDAIIWLGQRFEIVGIEHHAYGSVPHLELDVRLVGEPVTA